MILDWGDSGVLFLVFRVFGFLTLGRLEVLLLVWSWFFVNYFSSNGGIVFMSGYFRSFLDGFYGNIRWWFF